MNVTTIEVDQEEATKKYKEYLEVTKKRASRHYSQLKRAYRAASKGYKLIDIYQAFENTGVDKDGNPKLAIARADLAEVYLEKRSDNEAIFSPRRRTWDRPLVSDVNIPQGIFPAWPTVQRVNQSWATIKDPQLSTNVPIIPAHLLPEGDLANYYILFEVDKWSRIAPVKDPYLLQRVSENTFIVLAEWDVTDVEAIVMRGRNQ